MPKILLLYDTKEKDLARDLSDLLAELGCTVTMIPRAPDLGKTLQEKESHYFKETEGVVFLITHGADRGDSKVPSPSVAEEMGQAKVLFAKEPHRVMYLVDEVCAPQAIDQTAYISFKRDDMRSIVEALTSLIANLKAAKLIHLSEPTRQPAAPPATKPRVAGLADFIDTLDQRVTAVCEAMSHEPNGNMQYGAYHALLKKHGRNQQEANFIQRDLERLQLVTFQVRSIGSSPMKITWYTLMPLGWDVVGLLRKRRSRDIGKSLIELLSPTMPGPRRSSKKP